MFFKVKTSEAVLGILKSFDPVGIGDALNRILSKEIIADHDQDNFLKKLLLMLPRDFGYRCIDYYSYHVNKKSKIIKIFNFQLSFLA